MAAIIVAAVGTSAGVRASSAILLTMRIAIAGCTAAAAAIAVWRLCGSWAELPFLGLVVVSAALSWIDLTQRRLPNRIVLPAVGASVPLLLGAALLDGDLSKGLTALAGGAALFVLYLVLALISPRGMGMGDVKLAALVGLYAGYLGWETVLVAAFAGFLVGGIVGLIGIVAGRATRKTAIPFGPWMLVGLWIAVAITPFVTP
ncbi:MAG: peptidase [Rhodoglobus sp.]|nr:peptidase [Rhodoglobus sp.]